MQEQYISLTDLRKVIGIGDKTIDRIKDQLLQNELDSNYKSEYNENIKLDINDVHQGDCLELMNGIPDKSVDMILCDLPYGTTYNKWDTVLDMNKLWLQYERVIKDNGAIVLFGQEPFSTMLKNSNVRIYKYDWVWKKSNPSNIGNANIQPLKYHEYIHVFYKKQPIYNKQMIPRLDKTVASMQASGKSFYNRTSEGMLLGEVEVNSEKYNANWKNPSTILEFPSLRPTSKEFINHPTQKPVALCEYLIKTYTNEGEIVLDNCIGSGTTAIAAINTNRSYIGIELDENYYNIAKTRISEHILQNSNPVT